MMAFGKISCLLIVLGAASCAVAQDGPSSLRLSLAEAESLWLTHNREVRLARSALSGAEADVTSAGQAPNPQLSLNVASISPQDGLGRGGLRDKRMDSVLRIDQLVERGAKRELRSQAAEAMLKASRGDLDDTRRQQRKLLWSAYYDLLLAQEKRTGAAETAALYGKGLHASEIRYKAGDISGTDLGRLRIEKLRADNDARQAQADCEKAQIALAYLIGRETSARQLLAVDAWPDAAGLAPAGAFAAASGQAPAPLSAPVAVPLSDARSGPFLAFGAPAPPVSEAALVQRPDVRAAQARVDAAEKVRELARALRQRDVTVGVQFEHNPTNNPTNSFGVGFSVPLFLRYEYQGEIARAEVDLQAAREQLERVQALALGEVEQARAELAASDERRQRLESGVRVDAERVARAAELAYAKGAMGLLDLLDARRTARQVQLETMAARADYAKALAAWQAVVVPGEGVK